MKILGIDPGSLICGYGLIEKINKKTELLEYGVINLKKRNLPLAERLKDIFFRLNSVIERNRPDFSAFESLFYSKNAQSLMKLSHARAAALLSVTVNNIPVSEYSPREIKKSVTGNGNASKEQVSFMVKTILNIDETPEFFDVTDALAVALCHSIRMNSSSRPASSWEEFIRQNPGRVIKH